jgi:hypothetical protein
LHKKVENDVRNQIKTNILTLLDRSTVSMTQKPLLSSKERILKTEKDR